MLSNNNLQPETDEMKRLKQDLERAKRELEKLTKRLTFQEQEHTNRLNQIAMRSQGEQKDLERRHDVQMKHLRYTGSRDAEHETRLQQELKRDLTKWEAEKVKITGDIERAFKRGDYPNQAKFAKPQDAIVRSPDILRVNDHIQRINQELMNIERTMSRHKQSDITAESRLERYQQTEVDKLTNEQQNKVKALADAWLRESQSLKGQIQMYENIRTRTETRYKDLARQHTIDMKRMADMESRKRAQHGDNKGRKNYAKAEGDNVLDPKNAQGSNDTSTRRLGATRW